MLNRLSILPWRSFTLSNIHHSVDKGLLNKLRKKTGFPFIKCKKALEQHNNDLEKAEKWMLEQAQKEGWDKASKLQDRPMSQGLIGLIRDNNMAAMVEMNCETDFVARNAKFRELVSRTTSACLEEGKKSMTAKLEWDREAVNGLVLDDGRKLSDVVAMEVGHLGENMSLRRAVFLCCQGGVNTNIGHYVHSTASHPKEKYCLLGKFGALVSLVHKRPPGVSVSKQEMDDIGRQLSQHVVGMNPKELGYPEKYTELGIEVPEPDLEQDGEKKEQNKDSKLIYQQFLHEPSMSAGDYMLSQDVQMVDFVRFECGENLDD